MDETAAGIVEELREFLRENEALHAVLMAGLYAGQREAKLSIERLEAQGRDVSEMKVHLIHADESGEGIGIYGRAGVEERQAMLANGGMAEVRLGQQWLAFTFAKWEDDVRRRLARVHGCANRSDIRHPWFGDLALYRNDVIHHRGIATDKNSGRAAVLGWFQSGDPIAPLGHHVAGFSAIDLDPLLVAPDASGLGPAAA